MYLLTGIGSVRSFGSRRARLYLCVGLAVATVLAPWFALAVLVIGYASTFVFRPRAPASLKLTDLTQCAA